MTTPARRRSDTRTVAKRARLKRVRTLLRLAALLGCLAPLPLSRAFAQRQGEPQAPQFDVAAVTPFRDSFAVVLGRTHGWQVYAMERTATGFSFTDRFSFGPANNGNAEVLLDSQLKLVRVQSTGLTFGMSSTGDVHYAGQHATGFASRPTRTGPTRVPIDTVLPSGSFDNQALMGLILTLDWHPGAQYALTMFYADDGAIATQRLTVLAEEDITIPMGSRHVFRAELTDVADTTTETAMSIWVTTTKPHRIVKERSAIAETVLVAASP
jgi:Protein of unknown function (DUF3108)